MSTSTFDGHSINFIDNKVWPFIEGNIMVKTFWNEYPNLLCTSDFSKGQGSVVRIWKLFIKDLCGHRVSGLLKKKLNNGREYHEAELTHWSVMNCV